MRHKFVQPLCAIFLLLCTWLFAEGLRVIAQEPADIWTPPVDLSNSGAASEPVIVTKPNATLRVIWWDKFDGLMVADGSIPITATLGTAATDIRTAAANTAWASPTSAPILLPVTVRKDGEQVVVPTPIETMPRIVGDASGRAHAIWLGQPDEETGNRPLLYSRLGANSTSWSSPSTIVASAKSFDFTTDVSGTLHLIYVQPQSEKNRPIGLYYSQSSGSGAKWSAPVAVYPSRYLRLLIPQDDPIRVTAASGEDLYVTWDDPHLGRVMIAHSGDGGSSWVDAKPFLESEIQPSHGLAIALPAQPTSLLWVPSGRDPTMMAISTSGDALEVARWNVKKWSESKHLTLPSQNPVSGKQILLDDLHVAILQPDASGSEGQRALIVVGLDQNNDLWITSKSLEAIERNYDTSLVPDDNQSGAGSTAPVNLSNSGAASTPILVNGPDSTLHAFWWDQFDGLMVTDGAIFASTSSIGTEETGNTYELWSGPRSVPAPIDPTAQILEDSSGRVHAFWIEQPTRNASAASETLAVPLKYSQLSADGTSWATPNILAESAASMDAAISVSGILHLTYIQTMDTPFLPAGVYYRQSSNGGVDWTAPTPLNLSRYLRLLSPEAAHIRLAADGADGVYVTWDDPYAQQPLLAHSADGGLTWDEPKPIGDGEELLQRGRLVSVPGGETLLLWESEDVGSRCILMQAPASELVAKPTAHGQVLEELTTCPENERFFPLGQGQTLMVAGNGSDTLTLTLWDGSQWSEPTRLSFTFENPELRQQVYLNDLHAVLVELPPYAGEGLTGWTIVAIGTDQQGDVWITGSEMGSLELVFAPPPPWSTPESLLQSDVSPDLPATASDEDGNLHALWSETTAAGQSGTSLFYSRWDGSAWTHPVSVLRSTEGWANQPALVTVGDRLYAVWTDSQNGEILYSSAFSHDAYAAGGWNDPQPLPGPEAVKSWPDIEVGVDGSLHVVYAIPVNEGRGIYYTRSDDGGESWSEVQQVFDAARAGWGMAAHPRLAVDTQDLIHVVWTRADIPDSQVSEGVYYARSLDGGQTWSEPQEMALGNYAWPQIAVRSPGQVQILWSQATDQQTWWYRGSTDGGATWTSPGRVPGFGDVPGPTSLMADGEGVLHLVGLAGGNTDQPLLLYTNWNGERWSMAETFRLNLEAAGRGVSSQLSPTLKRIDTVFLGSDQSEQEAGQMALWHTGRLVPTVEVPPAPTFVLNPTVTPSPTPQPAATPTPVPSFGNAPPASDDGSTTIPFPLLLAGGLAGLVVAGAFGFGRLQARRR